MSHSLATVYATRAAMLKKSFYQFVKAFWKVLEPAEPLVFDEYIDGICQHLQACSDGTARWLLINMPPGLAKSKLTVLFMAWVWTHSPHERILHLSHSGDLSIRNVNWLRTVLKSTDYQNHFPVVLTREEEGNIQNTAQGSVFASSMGARNIGLRASMIVADDPNSDDETPEKRQEQIDKWNTEILSRLNNQDTGKWVVIQQRLGVDDISSYLLEHQRSEWVWLSLPMEYIPEEARTTEIGWKDSRTEAGQLLTSRLSEKKLKLLKDSAGSRYFAFYQQKPIPHKGIIFEELNIYSDEPEYFVCGGKRIPKKECRRFANTDLAISEKKTADYTVLCVWAVWKRYLILEAWYRARISAPVMVQKFRELYHAYNCDYIAIEDVAFQRSIIQHLQQADDRIQVKPVKAEGDKVARANSGAVIMMENKEIWICKAPEVESELKAFPNGKHDDIVDCVSYAAILKAKDNPFQLPDDWDKKELLSEEEQQEIFYKRYWEMVHGEPFPEKATMQHLAQAPAILQ